MRKLLAILLALTLCLSLTSFAWATEGGAAANTIDLATFVAELEKENYNYDGNGITVQWSPVSGCFGDREGHTCTVENVTATANTPKRVNSELTQFQLYEGESHAVSVKNVHFVYIPADFIVCANSGWAGSFTADQAPAGQLYLMNTGDVTFEGCTFDKVVLTSFECAGTTTITGCQFSNVYNNYAIKDARGANVIVTGNTITNCGGGIMVSSGTSVDKLTISGNTFKDVDVAGTASAEKVGTRALIQIADSGNYANTTFDFSGNNATNCGPAMRQLNDSAKAKVETNQNPLRYLNGTTGMYTNDSKKSAVRAGADYYDSLQEAINKINHKVDSTSLVLLDNITLTEPVDVKYNITLDLNGKTITNATGYTADYLLGVMRGKTLVVEDSADGGAITTTEVPCAIKMTLYGEAADGDAATLVVNGGTICGKDYGISGNGTRQNTDITINGGVIKGANSNASLAIYHPQRGNLLITGGELIGNTGLAMKSGYLTITGGTIKGTGADADYVHNSNGFNMTGDALAVEACDYPGGLPVVVKISGGSFISDHGDAVAYYQQADNYKLENEKFITGGTFSSDVRELVADGVAEAKIDYADGSKSSDYAVGSDAIAEAINSDDGTIERVIIMTGGTINGIKVGKVVLIDADLVEAISKGRSTLIINGNKVTFELNPNEPMKDNYEYTAKAAPTNPDPVKPEPEPKPDPKPERPVRRYPTNNTTTTTDTKTDSVTSARTFDAGVALYVGMSVLSLTGSAALLGKKKEF